MTDIHKWIDRIDNLLQVQKDSCIDLISTNFTRRELIELRMMMEVLMEREPKTAHWSHDGSHWENRWICSECGYKLIDEQTRFCPDCGAKMESEGEE